jgi:TolB-like protein
MREQQVAFGSFVFDRASGTLRQAGTIVPLGGRGAALLEALLEAKGGVVTKAALMEQVWPDTLVEDGNLTAQIAILRKVLGPMRDGQRWITTVSRVGYRLAHAAAEFDAATEASGKPSIAVLPFVNLSSDAEQDYFVDGMIDDLITALSRFKTFAVVARNSSFVYKNRAVDVREVARALGVRYVLEGSVRRAKRQVRVSAQLIEGASGAHLWAENFDGVLEDVFDFQDRITETVVGIVEPQVRQAEIERARRKRPENLDAYDLYLQALPLMHQGQKVVCLEDYDEAILLLDHAVALDPGFAPALAYAAWAHEKRLTRGGVAPPGVDDAKATLALAERAVAADSNDAIVMVIAGVSLITVKNDAEGGFALIRRALSLNPNSQLVARVAGYAHFYCGGSDESIECFLRAAQLSPGVPERFTVLGCIARSHLAMGRSEEALAYSLRSLAGYTGFDFAHCVAAASYAHLGRLEEARAAAQRALSIWPALTIASLLGRIAKPEAQDRLLIEGLLKAGMPAS